MYVRNYTTSSAVLSLTSAIDNLAYTFVAVSSCVILVVRWSAGFEIVYKPLDNLISLSFTPPLHVQWVRVTFNLQ